jgi:hypothetical protein
MLSIFIDTLIDTYLNIKQRTKIFKDDQDPALLE